MMLPERAAATNENVGNVAVGQFLRMALDAWFVSADPKVKPTQRNGVDVGASSPAGPDPIAEYGWCPTGNCDKRQ